MSFIAIYVHFYKIKVLWQLSICIVAEGKLNINVRLTGTRGGLGITVVGGRNVQSSDNNFGVYIKEVIPGQLAYKNGK